MRISCIAIAMALAAVASCVPASATTVAVGWTAAGSATIGDNGIAIRYGDTIIVQRSTGLAAINASTGTMRWRVDGVSAPVFAVGSLFVNGALSDDPSVPPLEALDPRTGRLRWKRSAAGGILAAIDGGVVVANRRSGITRYADNGKRLWQRDASGDYRRIVVTGGHIVALVERPGAITHGEIESIESATGKLVGTGAWFGELLDVAPTNAIGESDFPGDVDTWCGDTELLDVDLVDGVTIDQIPPPYHGLAMIRADYVLQSIQAGPRSSNDSNYGATPCTGNRAAHPKAILDGDRVALASGTVLGIFDRKSPAGPFARFDDATYVGGPFAGRLFVTRANGLNALAIAGHQATFTTIVPKSHATFTVAGLDSRLYASDGEVIVALRASDLHEMRRYAVPCHRVVAVMHATMLDVLGCSRSDGRESVVGLPR